MTSFRLHKWPRTPKSEPSRVGITVWGCYLMPMKSISMCSNTLSLSKMNEGRSLRRLSVIVSASTMTLCNHFDSISDPTPKSEPSSVGITVWGYCLMPMNSSSMSMCSNTLDMSDVDVDGGSSLMWLAASTMRLWHHFDSKRTPTPKSEPSSVGITV